jgi:N-acetylmuramoyl-L-alanine amidase
MMFPGAVFFRPFHRRPKIILCGRPSRWLLAAVVFLATLGGAFPGNAHAQFATLREPPKWGDLNHHQFTLTREEFESRLPLYSPNGAIRNWIELDPTGITVHATPDRNHPLWRLHWRLPPRDQSSLPDPVPISWNTLRAFTGAHPDLPLAGLTICLDPGHIGGSWAEIEERSLVIGRNPPIREGDMVLSVGRHLEKLLQQAGARVVWTREDTEPVTHLRPADLAFEAVQSMNTFDAKTMARLPPKNILRTWQLRTHMLFYRTAEISARAERVRQLQPDFTLCLHYNAAPWGKFSRPRLYNANKLVIFVHGAYTPAEIADETQRFHLFRKLLEGSAPLELSLAGSIADAMKEGWNLPPENYSSWEVAAKAGDHPYVWARNLIANRLFDGPTIFIEGPYMNDRATFARMQAGDYEGERLIQGRSVRSIHREFADFIAQGVISHYRSQLQPRDSSQPTP